MAVRRTIIKECIFYFYAMISMIICMAMSKADFSKLPVLGAFGPVVAITSVFAAVQVLNLIEKIRMKILNRNGKGEAEVYENTPWFILMLLSTLLLYCVISLVDVFLCGFDNPLLILFSVEILTLLHICVYGSEVKKQIRKTKYKYEEMLEEEECFLDEFRIDDSKKQMGEDGGEEAADHREETKEKENQKSVQKNETRDQP